MKKNEDKVLKVTFLLGSCGRERWMWEIYQEMNRRNKVDAHFIAFRKNDIDFLVSKGVKKDSITEIVPYTLSKKLDLDYIVHCEEKYSVNVWDLWNISLSRKKNRAKIPKEEVLRYFQYVFESVEKIMKTFKPEYSIVYGIAGYHSTLISKMFDELGVHNLELVASQIPNRFSFAKDLTNIWPLLIKNYDLILNNKDSFTKEVEEAKKYVYDFNNKPVLPDCRKKFSVSKTKTIKKYFRYLIQLLRYRKLPSNLRFMFWPIIQKYYDFCNYFEKINLEENKEKYVLFPLHFQPEATTLIFGKWYVDQLNLIEKIAMSIPADHMLYVKEHPFGYGNRNPAFYQRIKRLPNVRLISPHMNNTGFIKNSKLLLTITGTSGWEALLLGIPVITFGDIFYNISSETYKIKQIEELPIVIKNRLKYEIDEEKIAILVAALFKASYPGLARLPTDCNDASLEADNVNLLVNGIYDYLAQLNDNKK